MLGVPAPTACKQLLFGYAGNCILFVYAILCLDIFNLTMVIPMTVLNFVFLGWNAKVVYDNDKAGHKLFRTSFFSSSMV